MRTNAVLTEGVETRADETLREVVEALAPMERLAGSEGEREAADWIAERLDAAGASATVDEEEFLDGFAPLIAGDDRRRRACPGSPRSAAARRELGIAGGAAAAALIADEVSNGLRPVRRAAGPRKTTWNVVAEAGDPEADRTLVLMAHHDAARTGLAFDQNLQRKLVDWFPGRHRADRHLDAAVVDRRRRARDGRRSGRRPDGAG